MVLAIGYQYGFFGKFIEAYMFAPVMVTPVELPTSKASVLCPREVPAELSITTLVTTKSVAELMLMS